jgi:hypothetical protein
MRSIVGRALEHRDECDRSLKSRLNAHNYSRIPMAQDWKRWRLGPARAITRDLGLRGVRLILPLAFDRSVLNRTVLRLFALAGTPNFSSSQFSPFVVVH